MLTTWDLFGLALYEASWSVVRGNNEISSPSRAPVCGMHTVPLTLPPSLVDQMLESRHCFWGSLSPDAMWFRLPFIKHGPSDGAHGVFVE